MSKSKYRITRSASIFLCLLLINTLNACATLEKQQAADKSDKYRAEALELSKKHHYGLALSKIKLAIKESHFLPVGSFQAIEAYDDAGLYYYNIEDFENSAYHQSVAVLLAYENQISKNMYAVYLKRLGWAFSRYFPDYDFDRIRDDPLILLSHTELNLKNNRTIRSKFYRKTTMHPKFRSSHYVLKRMWITN